MKKPKLSTLLYGAIAVCLTVMLILFTGTLSGEEDKMEAAPVTDSLFIPESVVKLTGENQILKDAVNNCAEKLESTTVELEAEKEKVKIFNEIVKAAQLIEEGNIEGATNLLNKVDLTKASENAKVLHNMVLQQMNNKGE